MNDDTFGDFLKYFGIEKYLNNADIQYAIVFKGDETIRNQQGYAPIVSELIRLSDYMKRLPKYQEDILYSRIKIILEDNNITHWQNVKGDSEACQLIKNCIKQFIDEDLRQDFTMEPIS